MSHFLKEQVTNFSNLQSLKTALESVAKGTSILTAGNVRIYGGVTKWADLACPGIFFGLSRDFGYTQEGNQLNCICDSMDRHQVSKIEKEARTKYLAEEVKQTMSQLGFSSQSQQTVNGTLQTVYTRWR